MSTPALGQTVLSYCHPLQYLVAVCNMTCGDGGPLEHVGRYAPPSNVGGTCKNKAIWPRLRGYAGACNIQEPLDAPFLNGLFSREFWRGKMAP